MWAIVFWVVIGGVVLAVPELLMRISERRQERASLRRRLDVMAEDCAEQSRESKQALDDFLRRQFEAKLAKAAAALETARTGRETR
jgi:hypothetical protein